jgi:hypothetical protein
VEVTKPSICEHFVTRAKMRYMGKLWDWFRDSQQPLRKRRPKGKTAEEWWRASARSTGPTTTKRGYGGPTQIEGLDLAHDRSPGTSLQGYLGASYADLVRLLGPPNVPVDNYKTTTEWSLQYEGAPITIYDYKATSAYGSGRPSPERFRALSKHNWHVGSDGSATANRGIQLIRDSLAHSRPQRQAQTRARGHASGSPTRAEIERDVVRVTDSRPRKGASSRTRAPSRPQATKSRG